MDKPTQSETHPALSLYNPLVNNEEPELETALIHAMNHGNPELKIDQQQLINNHIRESEIRYRQAQNRPPINRDRLHAKSMLKELNFKIPTRKPMNSNLLCPICLQCTTDRVITVKLSCAHVFHKPCLDKWLALKRECPCCRKQLTAVKPNPETRLNTNETTCK